MKFSQGLFNSDHYALFFSTSALEHKCPLPKWNTTQDTISQLKKITKIYFEWFFRSTMEPRFSMNSNTFDLNELMKVINSGKNVNETQSALGKIN